MPFVSISIDLAGSTLAKQSIILSSEDGTKERADLYKEYLNLLFSVERDFYLYLFEQLDEISVERSCVFLVKSIGDELWYAIDVDIDDNRQLARLSEAIITACTRLISSDKFLSSEFQADESEDSLLDARTVSFPLKILIDLILEPIEITNLRYEFVKDILSQYPDEKSVILPKDNSLNEICNTLNLGRTESGDDNISVHARKDFIGLEIDRFFRCTKYARPLLIALGDELFSRLPATTTNLDSSVQSMRVNKITFETDRTSQPDLLYIPEKIPANKLKGVGKEYMLHHLFQPEDFSDKVKGMTPASISLLSPSFSFLAESGYFLLQK